MSIEYKPAATHSWVATGLSPLPTTGFLRQPQIIGEAEITEAQAEANRQFNNAAAAKAIKNGHVDKNGQPKFVRRPTTARPATAPLIPVKKSTWWAGVKSGRYPKPVRTLGVRITAWRVEDIRKLIEAQH